jgi:hypothetical protein
MAKETNTIPELPVGVSNEELKALLEQNLALLQETHEMTHKIKSYITFQKVMSIVYLILIVGPIILSIIYLPPLLKNAFSQYSDLVNPANPGAILKNLEGSSK